jgi:hypothetical protein
MALRSSQDDETAAVLETVRHLAGRHWFSGK